MLITQTKKSTVRNIVKSIKIYVDNGWNVTANYFQYLWWAAQAVEMEPFDLEDLVNLNPEDRAYALIVSQL